MSMRFFAIQKTAQVVVVKVENTLPQSSTSQVVSVDNTPFALVYILIHLVECSETKIHQVGIQEIVGASTRQLLHHKLVSLAW